MNRIVEIPSDLPADWPRQWEGTTRIDCGSQGSLLTTLSISGHPGAVHVSNFSRIIGRWQYIWPTICKTLTEKFDCRPPIGFPGTVLELRLPDGPIDNAPLDDGSDWSVTLRFHKIPGAWTVSFNCWDLNLESSGYDYKA